MFSRSSAPINSPMEHVLFPGQIAAPQFPPPPPKRSWLRRLWRPRIYAAILFVFILLIGWLAITAPLSKSLEPIAPPQITLLSADGTPIARNGANVEAPVVISKLPPHVVQAFLAIEDRRFYSHWGIDPRGLARAAWTNLTTGTTQGGSTITQQLAKITFLSSDQNLTRKARELLIAFWLEAWLTKDEILERYLSNAYFGDNAYGLRAASLHYFNRQPEKLTRAQAAMLAGLMKAPSRLAPTRNYERAEQRMRLVVLSLKEAGYITAAEAAEITPPKLDVRRRSDLPTGTYFADWALPQARKLSDGGYARESYTTTLDARLQAAARQATAQFPLRGAQVALVAMRPNGEVVAMVGGKNYAESSFNRVTQSRRQPGSTFKLFVYLAALQEGWAPGSRIDNKEITTGGYRPRNASGNYSDSLTLEQAFSQSSNVAALRLFNTVGDKNVIRLAHKLGISSPIPEGDPSVALGTSGMTLMELTAAYAGVASNRFPVTPTAFKSDEGEGWFDRMLDRRTSLSTSNHRDIERMLRATVTSGTGRAAQVGSAAYGKTGTSQDNRDALFIGYTRDLVVGVWVGNDDNSPLHGVTGGGLPARIWRDFVNRASGRAPTAPAKRVNPRGPVQPLDLPDSAEIPLGEGSSVKLERGQATINTEIGGVPLGVRIDDGGVRIEGRPTSTPSARPSPPPAAQPSPRVQPAPVL